MNLPAPICVGERDAQLISQPLIVRGTTRMVGQDA